MLLQKKLFYSSMLRYMIVSNLKLNFSSWAFLVATGSFDTITEGLKTSTMIMILIGLFVFPIFIIAFMIIKKKVLSKPEVAQKWDTLYQGINIDQLSCLFYNAIFCIRRFNIVVVNMIFSPGLPLTNFDRHQYLYKNFAIIFIQTVYVIYIASTRPHSESIFNLLELFNEGMIILMCYIMICYTGIGDSKLILEDTLPVIISLTITALIVMANFGVLIRMTVKKIKQRSAQKYRDKRSRTKRRLRMRIKKWTLDSLPDSHPMKPLALIPEESHECTESSISGQSDDALKDIDDAFGLRTTTNIY